MGLFYYFLGLFLYAWMIIALFPMVKTVKGAYIDSMPEQFLKFFGDSSPLSMGTIEGFLSLEFLSLFFILIISFYIGSSAGSTMAGTIEKRTIDFQLSQPISRTRLVLAETIVGLLGTALLVLLTDISIYILAKFYHIDISGKGLLSFAIVAIIFLWAFYGIGSLFSSIMKSKITVAAATVSLVMALYVFNAITRIIDKLTSYEKYTLFNMYNPEAILKNGEISSSHLAVLLIILILSLSLSIFIFNRRDL